MMRVSLAVLSLLGLAGAAAPARADDLHFEFGVGVRDGRVRDGYVGVGTDRPDFERPTRVVPAPRPRYVDPIVVADPAPWPRRDRGDDFGARPTYVPAHLERRRETVCVPAVYEDRLVPVFEDRCVPVFGEVSVPVFDERLVPTFEVVLDRRTGRPHRVQVGVRTERVQVGTRLERVRVGERHEQVQVGTRTEHVLVRAESCRVVEREEWVPGQYVTGGRPEHDRHHFDRRDGAYDDRHDDRGDDRR